MALSTLTAFLQRRPSAHIPSPLRESAAREDDEISPVDTSTSNESAGSVPGISVPTGPSTQHEMDGSPTFMISGHLSPDDGNVLRAWTPDSALSRSPAASFEADTSATSNPIPMSRFVKGRLASLKASPSSIPKVHVGSLTINNSFEEVPGSFDFTQFDNFEAMDAQFEIDLKEQLGWRIEKVSEDGNCLFRSLSDQLWGHQDEHLVLRLKTMDYMEVNKDLFAHFILDSEPFEHYITRKRKQFVFANDLEISAAASALRRRIELYRYSPIPFLVYQPEPPLEPHEAQEPLRIAFQRSNHYNSIRSAGAIAELASPISPISSTLQRQGKAHSDSIFDMEEEERSLPGAFS